MSGSSFNEGLGKRLQDDRAVFRASNNRRGFVAIIVVGTLAVMAFFLLSKWIGF